MWLGYSYHRARTSLWLSRSVMKNRQRHRPLLSCLHNSRYRSLIIKLHCHLWGFRCNKCLIGIRWYGHRIWYSVIKLLPKEWCFSTCILLSFSFIWSNGSMPKNPTLRLCNRVSRNWAYRIDTFNWVHFCFLAHLNKTWRTASVKFGIVNKRVR